MVWAALLYAGGRHLAHHQDRPAAGARSISTQQRFEADFRFSLVRLRENTESVALLWRRGPRARHLPSTASPVSSTISGHHAARMKRSAGSPAAYGQVAIIFPYLVAAPRYFAKQIQLGGLMQIADAFGQVQNALSFIVNSYTDIADWQAVVAAASRASTAACATIAASRQRAAADRDRARRRRRRGRRARPRPARRHAAAARRHARGGARRGGAARRARPAAGKSTLLRAIAGIWPFGRGHIRLGEGDDAVPAAEALSAARHAAPGAALSRARTRRADGDDWPRCCAQVGLGALRARARHGRQLGAAPSLRRAAAARLRARAADASRRSCSSTRRPRRSTSRREAALYRAAARGARGGRRSSASAIASLREFHDAVIDSAAARQVSAVAAK